MWQQTSEYVYLKADAHKFENNKKLNLACFDLDQTLIKPKSGKKFPINEDDWQFCYNNIITKLKEYHDTNYCVIIISNQARFKSEWKNKLDKIIKELDIPVSVYASIAHNKYRKPMIGFMEMIATIFSSKSFYCGDACGRYSDHADTDIKFALNAKLKFIVPEKIFMNTDIPIPKILYKPFEDMKIYTDNVFVKRERDVIILVGYSGSGKSTFARKYFDTYEYINQDILKTKKECINKTKQYLLNGKSVIIDNTNPSGETRKIYIDLIKNYSGYTIRCIHIATSKELSMHNANYRMCYENGQHIPEIAYNIYKKKFRLPDENEFAEIITHIPKYENSDAKYSHMYLY